MKKMCIRDRQALARALRVTDIVDVDTTALWEVNLDKIKHGELSYLDFKKDILKATNCLLYTSRCV